MLKLGLLGFSLGLALVMCEVVVRVARPQQVIRPLSGVYERNDRYGWRHVPGLDEVVNTGERDARVVTDVHGFRIPGPGETPSPADADLAVLAIGDSFIEGLMVDGDQTIPKVLEQLLNERGAGSVEVVNTGTAAWGPFQYHLQSVDELARRDYDLGLVFLYTGNDFKPDREIKPADLGARHTFRLPTSLAWNEWVRAIFWPINDALEVRSHLFVLAKNQLELLRARFGFTNFYFPPIHRTDLDLDRYWAYGFEMCGRIAEAFAAHDVPVLFVLLPADYQVRADLLARYTAAYGWDDDVLDMDLPSDAMREQFRQRPEWVLLDPLEHLRAAEPGDALFGSVDKHFTARAHRMVAEFLLPDVAAALPAPTGASPAEASAAEPAP